MASLTIISSRNEDNSTTLTVTLPARRNGEVNFGALARINRDLLLINPQAFDPPDPPDPPPLTTAVRDGHTADGAGIVLAELRHDAAESPNPLNTADTVGPGEA
jgi:hypothetical protein